MSQNARFTATCFALLLAAWLFSGERLLDAAFEMPDLGPIDDALLTALVAAEELKAQLALPDMFGALRSTLHTLLGL